MHIVYVVSALQCQLSITHFLLLAACNFVDMAAFKQLPGIMPWFDTSVAFCPGCILDARTRAGKYLAALKKKWAVDPEINGPFNGVLERLFRQLLGGSYLHIQRCGKAFGRIGRRALLERL